MEQSSEAQTNDASAPVTTKQIEEAKRRALLALAERIAHLAPHSSGSPSDSSGVVGSPGDAAAIEHLARAFSLLGG